jgi:hypothetical protein
MSKFLLNLLLQIFKALINSKIQFLVGKEFFLRFQPNRPSGQPARPASQPSQPPALPLFSHRPCVRAQLIPACAALAYWPKYVSSSRLRSPATTSSPSVTAKLAPLVSSISHLTPADPGHAAASLGHPVPPRLCLEMPSQGVNPALIPRVNPLLNHPPHLQWR